MKILFIQTGGSIDKDYPTKVKGYAFEFGDPAFKNILHKVDLNFKYETLTIFKKDSLDMNEKDRQKIYDYCAESKYEKIIITHGTDTMSETAKVLSGLKGKTIVLTGSFLPEKFYDSEADFNVGVAVGAINILNNGVYIAMNGRIYEWNKCKKDLSTGQFVDI